VQGSTTLEIDEAQPGKAPIAPAAVAMSRRWVLDAAMFVLLGISGCILWYGNQPPELRPRSLQHWIQLHWKRSR
jgi:hypothetical protein